MNATLHDFSLQLKQKKIDYLGRMNNGYFSLLKPLFSVLLVLNSEVIHLHIEELLIFGYFLINNIA